MYSTNEAAEKLGLSQDHVRLLARTGVIEAKKLGHDWVVLNLDYKRKRRSKETKYFQLTPSGSQEITGLEHQGRDDEVEILRSLLKGRATVGQISDETHIVSSTVRLNLRQFKKENWIIEIKAEAPSLEGEIPGESQAQVERPGADSLEQEIPEEEEPGEEAPEQKIPEESKAQVERPGTDSLEQEIPEEEEPGEEVPEQEISEESKAQEERLEADSLDQEIPEEEEPGEEGSEPGQTTGPLLVYDF